MGEVNIADMSIYK